MYGSAPVVRTSAACASSAPMPPAREIFRHTASAAPEASAPGSAAVSSIAIAHAGPLAQRAQRLDPVDRLLDELEAGGRERGQIASTALVDVPRAVGVQAQRDVGPGGRAHRGDARRRRRRRRP